MTLKEARKFIKQCEAKPLKIERTELLSQGPGQGWAVSIQYGGGGGSFIAYSANDKDKIK